MQNQVMNMISEYRLAIMIGILAVLILLPKKKPGGNKLLLIMTIALAVSIIYELVMNEPVSRIPAHINQVLNKPGPTKTTNPHYHVSPEKRYTHPEER
ncbi:MAG: hypothetical protein GQ559_01370 [Desulfobulbaceae bacterium]|nr:hypothetical protein [Desulfobulbaceae bacterium]